MPTFQIKSRFSGAVLFECELTAEIADKSYSLQLGFAVKAAVRARANLAGADLADANLADANLADADLAGVDLADADLAHAYLAGANLARANLADANLAGADLARANLAGANLAGADLADANLADANLADANLADANLAGANLAGANLAGAKNVPETNGSESIRTPDERREWQRARAERFRARFPEVPVIESLDAKILQAVESGGKLDMSAWHRCETTHCRAGWAITLAGDAGKELEALYSANGAGRLIYLASTGRIPSFFASNDAAMADMREQAALWSQS